jgi:uncharacterized protein YjcR
MEKKEKRKGGAPKGNQNARTHGFYSKALDATQREDMDMAIEIGDIDDEIALLRVKIKAVLEKDPENFKLILQATNILAGMMIKKYQINKDQKKGLKEAIITTIKEIALPAGINLGADIIAKRFN